jgi:hypothetical protein
VRSLWGRALAIGAGSIAVLLASAAPAQAHAVHVGVDPSNWRSTITGVQPIAANVRVSLGDGAQRLTISVSGPTQVVVLGYNGEPFLRLSSTGAWVNQHSTTTWSIAGGRVLPQAGLNDHATPSWKQVSDAGTWRWHDARTHWAGYAPPPPVQEHPDRRQQVGTWAVPVLVAGQPGAITGRIDWIPGPNPTWGTLFIVVPLLVLIAAGFVRRWRLAAVAALTLVTAADLVHAAGLVAGRVGSTWTRLAALPGHGAISVLLWAAMATCATGIARRRHVTASVYGAAMLAAVIFLSDGVPSVALVWRSQGITGLPIDVDRYLVAALTGSSLGLLVAAIVLIRRLDRRPPPRAPLRAAPVA